MVVQGIVKRVPSGLFCGKIVVVETLGRVAD